MDVVRHRARRRIGIGLAGAGVLVTTLAVVSNASQAGATGLESRHFDKAPASASLVRPASLSSKPITVVVQMAGDPVTVTDANSATKLTKAERQARKDSLRQAQLPAESKVRGFGGKVLGNYQEAYNGFKVQIAGNKVNQLRSIPNVVGVHQLQTFKPDNVHGVPLIGAPAVWDGLNGFHGEGVKVAVIDTGIDYTHADFGGPGTVAAYDAALATDTQPADPTMFGPDAPKVKGGYDFVGDNYNANNAGSVPVPDSNPLDCAGHGTHVAGTAVGFGVLSDGSTYHGAYNSATVSGHDWTVGPGVAPKADLYSLRVFGCEGSTNVVIDAIEWAVDHGMDVINMSLGSPWGTPDDPSAVASNNAAKDGVIVVASAGNENQVPYEEGSPASGSDVISVAAMDPTASFPGANVTLAPGGSSTAIDANGAPISNVTLPVVVLKNGSDISLGCDPQEYVNANVAGKIAVVQRGTCARVARAIFGEKAGAAAVVMVNNAAALPPYEGQITNNPDPGGEQFNVTIPFLGVSSTDKAKWFGADGGTATLAATTINNPGFKTPASFTSGGPRSGDSWLKPNVSAPGVSIFSAGMGTGNGVAVLSGTSMAAPHTTGMAALVRQAHPTWNNVKYLKAAIENTAVPSGVAGYTTRVAGTGLIQAPGATQTQVVALGNGGTASVNFGYSELASNYQDSKAITLRNFSNSAASFDVTIGNKQGSAHTASVNQTHITVPARGTASVNLTLSVNAATAGSSAAFHDVAGLVTFTPSNGNNNGVALRVPYYFVPQTTSHVKTQVNVNKLNKNLTGTATVSNDGTGAGSADFYAWGLHDTADSGLGHTDVTDVGVQSFASDGFMAFAIGTNAKWSTADDTEWDILVDVNNDGDDDYAIVTADLGVLQGADATGQLAVAVFPLHTDGGDVEFLATAPFNSSTLVVPVLFSQLCTEGEACLSADTNPRFTYHAQSSSLLDSSIGDVVAGSAVFNPFTSAISTGQFDSVAPGASATETVSINSAEWAQSPAKGLMIISPDNKSTQETQTIAVIPAS